MITIVNNEQETATFANSFYNTLRGGECIGLIGSLGAGKTTFVKYFAVAAGVAQNRVSSPSFVLSYEYSGSKFKLDHWDIYRLNSEPEELWEPPKKNEIRLIEWVDRVDELVQDMDIIIKIDFDDLKNYPERRRFEVIDRRK